MKFISALCAGIVMLSLCFAACPASHASVAPFSNAVIIIIRHGEKADDGSLSPAGQNRATAYINYFKAYIVDAHPLHLSAIYAAADSADSDRCRVTVEPLGRALGIAVNTSFKNKHSDKLASALQTLAVGKQVLICWHHAKIPDLLTALGADPNQLIPGGIWPDDQFGWVIQLCYDKNGHLIPSKTKRIQEPF